VQQLITLARKQETRKKIQLGGLVVKAGLSEESTAILLGILFEAAETLQSNDATKARNRWKALGDVMFSKK
jgi:hypothetical protein